VDRERAFVGSPNIDPRSMVLNTELGVVGDGPAFAERVAALIERDMSPANSWRVTMDEEGWLLWTNGDEAVRRQPAQGFRQRLEEFLLNLLPMIKDQA
jgi:putative cardiolipin synthase